MINILGHTLFDLDKIFQIEPTEIQEYASGTKYTLIIRLFSETDRFYTISLGAKTQSEADSARAELENAVKKAKGIA